MKIQFLKDHHFGKDSVIKAGIQIDNHPNEQYLITMGVAVEVKEVKKKKKDGV
jgi:hypothetical protein